METENNLNSGLEQTANKDSIIQKGEIDCVGGPIPLEKARKWNQNYRRMFAKDTTSHLFGRGVIEKILRQKNCAGIRIHYCIDDSGKKQLVLSGVDHNGNDQLPRGMQASKADTEPHALQAAGEDQGNDNQLYDQSWPCPGTRGCPSNDLAQN